MCGIVGYTGRGPALGPLLVGLRNLEYRGYDSAGLALLDSGRLVVVKRAGKISELEQALAGVPGSAAVGVAHTRWATHGIPNERNAHPHADCSGEVVIVHNGIIENYRELREELEARGHVFVSETDSEVIAHLIEEEKGAGLAEAVRRAARRMEGAFAVAALSAREPGLLVGVRRDAPLLAGLAEDAGLLASAVTALLPYTRRVLALGQDEVAEVSPGRIRLTDLEGRVIEREAEEVSWTQEAAEKGGYPDFMLKEIYEQPQAVRDTLAGRVAGGRVVLDELRVGEDEVRAVDKVFAVACGTSYHAGLVAKYLVEKWARVPVEVEVASEFRYRDPVLGPRSLVLAISQSGETADTLAAARHAAGQGARVVAVTNVVGSALALEADAVLYTRAGLEIGVAATKTFAAQLAAVSLFTLWMAGVRGVLGQEEILALLGRLRELPRAVEGALETRASLGPLEERILTAGGALFLGRNVGYPVALEGALKLKEISYLHAEGFPAGEMKHGPIALVEPGFPVVGVATGGPTHPKLLSNLEEVRARGAWVAVVAREGEEVPEDLAEVVVRVPSLDPYFTPAAAVVPLQLLAYGVAKARGCDVDKPRNLAKSVTVE